MQNSKSKPFNLPRRATPFLGLLLLGSLAWPGTVHAQCNACFQLSAGCDLVGPGQANTLSGTVTNCGDVTLTNVVITDNLYGLLATFPALPPGGAQAYAKAVTNSCGATVNVVTATATSTCGSPLSLKVTNVCVVAEASPCVALRTSCNLVALGQTNLISAVVSNCGNATLASVVVVDSLYGPLGSSSSLAPAGSVTFAKAVTNWYCGVPNVVTVTAQTACGTLLQARATNQCILPGDCRPRLFAPALGANGQFSFTLAGPNGSNFVIQAASNLATPNWLSLHTNVTPFTFVESNAALHPARFYRAMFLP